MSDYKKRMQKKKSYIDKRISKANINKNLIVLLTGNGKGKTSSALGMIMRALGYKMKIGIVQFIKGRKKTGEDLFLENEPLVTKIVMKTGFTWDTKNKEKDIIAAQKTWEKAKKLLQDDTIKLIVLDEITYMLNYKYLDEDEVINTILNRPKNQHLILTGRAANAKLIAIADTVSEVRNIKHAFNNNIKAQKTIDF